ncbi:hypothetical protein JB92DRAFT_2731485 [Gautieria morchelliformis]|nr:hypothetical protein JB92DRAFT_2731485 [Gautieria morchelliformis]
MRKEQQEQTERVSEPGSSKRYRNFYSALQLATQSAASKWTYEDFKECFPTYCEEFPVKAQTLRTQMAKNILEVTKQQCDQLLAEHDAPAATDVLHEIVLEGRARKQMDQYPSKDVWISNLEPRAAVHARTVPVLQSERDRMLLELDKLAAENEGLVAELEANEIQQRDYDDRTSQKLDALDQVVASFEGLPLQDMEQWAMDAEESLGSRA